ncbi:MAG: hypothetical protein ABI895_31445 [Deltaproteobacteria bacterium]
MTEVPSGSAQLELERAHAALISARVLLGAGQHADAISRAGCALGQVSRLSQFLAE